MSPDPSPDPTPTVTCYRDGPILVRGAVEWDGCVPAEWRDRPSVALCRCGHSGGKPLCDGSHKLVRFRAPGR